MDQERMDLIKFGQEHMGAELLTQIEKFKEFDNASTPIVTILCSDNRLYMQMQKLTYYNGSININVCGTFNGIEDAVEKLRFSDAVIVNTLALKIAPDGLYKTLKSAEMLGKDVYFILSGWESLPKNSDIGKRKLAQIDFEFPFSNIKASRNVFVKELEGFSLIEDVMNDYIKRITDSFEFIHNNQVEALYKALCGEIKQFREKTCIEIQKEQSLVIQLHQNLMAKQRRYEITFSHATVGLNELLERFEKTIQNIDADEILYALESDNMSAKENYINSPEKSENKVKKAVYEKITTLMNSFQSSSLSNSTFSSKNDLQIDETMNDLLSITSILSPCQFIDRIELEELEQTIRETNELFSTARAYDSELLMIMDRVKDSLRAKIIGFQFEAPSQNEIKEFINNILAKAPEIVKNRRSKYEEKDEEESNENSLKNKGMIIKDGIKKVINILPSKSTIDDEDTIVASPNVNDETVTEVTELDEEMNDNNQDMKDRVQEAKWNHFYIEVQRLITYSKNALSVLISENSKLVNEEIDIQSKNNVSNYFSFIIEKLNCISDELNRKYTEYGRLNL